jgi:hypothetical protein
VAAPGQALEVRHPEKLDRAPYTLQEVAALFRVHEKTAARWFKDREVFRPTRGTVRITQAQLDLFIQESGKKVQGLKSKPA